MANNKEHSSQILSPGDHSMDTAPTTTTTTTSATNSATAAAVAANLIRVLLFRTTSRSQENRQLCKSQWTVKLDDNDNDDDDGNSIMLEQNCPEDRVAMDLVLDLMENTTTGPDSEMGGGDGGGGDDDDDSSNLSSSSDLLQSCSSIDSLTSLSSLSSLSSHSTNSKTSPWRKVRSLVTSPFMQTYKRQRYPWIQLAGHQGNFQSGKQPGTILKKSSGNERLCFEMLMRQDSLMDYVPRYFGEVLINQQVYLQLQDLLADFVNPCIMDVKMGVRTYLEDELIKAGEKPKLRKDMYEKMVAIDPAEPTAQEHAQRAITKPRYMVWRETISSTSTLAYRIDGIKLTESGLSDGSLVAVSGGGGGGGATAAAKDCAKDFKRIKSECDVRCAIHQFTANRAHCIPKYRNKLATIRAALTNSNFFWGHELIGSSLLFVHDEIRADIWLIDFAKSYPLPGDCPSISHQSEWKLGNHEDGYLTGFDNLATLFGTL